MLKKIKNIQALTAIILIFIQCSTDNNKLFDKFYKDAENKFSDCLDFAFNKYNQHFDYKDCDMFLKPDTEKRFDKNGINSDRRILGASLKATEFGSNMICGYSKKFVGHYDKPIFDKTIYNVVSSSLKLV